MDAHDSDSSEEHIHRKSVQKFEKEHHTQLIAGSQAMQSGVGASGDSLLGSGESMIGGDSHSVRPK